MAVTTKQLLTWIQTLHTQAASGGVPENTIEKHRAVTSALIKQGENLNFAISAAKIHPGLVDINELTDACRKHAPAWIDALLQIDGVDKAAVQSEIIQRQHPSDVISRMQSWYPGATTFSVPVQRQWAKKVHDICKKETSTGTAYQRRLSFETGEALESAVSFLGNKITDPVAATWVLRASHHVLRAMTRTVPLLHALPEDFAERTLEALWSYAMDQKDNRDEWRINAQAFTLANTEAFPDARSWITMHYPNEGKVVNNLWDKHALQVNSYFSSQRARYGITSTIVQREGDWAPPEDSTSKSLSKGNPELPLGIEHDSAPSLS